MRYINKNHFEFPPTHPLSKHKLSRKVWSIFLTAPLLSPLQNQQTKDNAFRNHFTFALTFLQLLFVFQIWGEWDKNMKTQTWSSPSWSQRFAPFQPAMSPVLTNTQLLPPQLITNHISSTGIVFLVYVLISFGFVFWRILSVFGLLVLFKVFVFVGWGLVIGWRRCRNGCYTKKLS